MRSFRAPKPQKKWWQFLIDYIKKFVHNTGGHHNFGGHNDRMRSRRRKTRFDR